MNHVLEHEDRGRKDEVNDRDLPLDDERIIEQDGRYAKEQHGSREEDLQARELMIEHVLQNEGNKAAANDDPRS